MVRRPRKDGTLRRCFLVWGMLAVCTAPQAHSEIPSNVVTHPVGVPRNLPLSQRTSPLRSLWNAATESSRRKRKRLSERGEEGRNRMSLVDDPSHVSDDKASDTPTAAFCDCRTSPSVWNAVASSAVVLGRNLVRQICTPKTLQLGVILLLGHVVIKAAKEVWEDMENELMTLDEEDSTGSALFCRPEAVQRLVEWLSSPSMDTPNKAIPLHVVRLAKKLLAIGMPLTGSTPSVESILKDVTRGEAQVLQQCLWVAENPNNDMQTVWSEICGLQNAKQRIASLLLADARSQKPRRAAFASLLQRSPGILLYGPPGCGKTMLIRALAQTTRGVPCLVVTPSVLLRKYVGDTNLQVRHLMKLAQKIAPCIICIDELDGIFRARHDTEHDVSRDLKTEFLQWWDGLPTKSSRIWVVGATNRPFDVDGAVLRRLPHRLHVGFPELTPRYLLLKQWLEPIPKADDVSLQALAAATEGYSPSDLRQLVETAVLMGPLRRMEANDDKEDEVLTTSDLQQALEEVPPTPMSWSYRTALDGFINGAQQQQRQQQHPASAPEDPSGGNFYDIGTLHIEPEVMDILWNVWQAQQQDLNDSDDPDDDLEEEEEDDEL